MKKFLPILLVAAGLTLSAQVKAEEVSLGTNEVINISGGYYERSGLVADQVVTLCLPYKITKISGSSYFVTTFIATADDVPSVTEVIGTNKLYTLDPGVPCVVKLKNGETSFRVEFDSSISVSEPVSTGVMRGNMSATAFYPKTVYQGGVMEPYILGKYDCEGDVCEIGFCRCGVNGHIGQYRAYLNMSQVIQGSCSPERISLVLGVESSGAITAEEEVKTEKVVCKKTFINGQLVIEKDGVLYNSLGQQL